jgi:hypothetical protein
LKITEDDLQTKALSDFLPVDIQASSDKMS